METNTKSERLHRRHFANADFPNEITQVLSPIPTALLRLTAYAVVAALLLILLTWINKVPVLRAHETTSFIVAHVVWGVGECVLLACLWWSLRPWAYFPRRLLLLFTVLTALLHIAVVASQLTDISPVRSGVLALYTAVGLLLCANVLISMEGRILMVFGVMAVAILAGAAAHFLSMPLVATAAYVTAKVATILYVVLLSSLFSTYNSHWTIG